MVDENVADQLNEILNDVESRVRVDDVDESCSNEFENFAKEVFDHVEATLVLESPEEESPTVDEVDETASSLDIIKSFPPGTRRFYKALENIPEPSSETGERIVEMFSSLSLSEMSLVSERLSLLSQISSVTAAKDANVGSNICVGTVVEVIGGAAKYVGATGVVTEKKRIRCFVQLDNLDKIVYFYTSDVKEVANVVKCDGAQFDEVPF